MDGVIVTVVHDEFRGMGLSGVGEFLGAGAVLVDVRGMVVASLFAGVNFVYFAIRKVQKDVKGLVLVSGVICGKMVSNRPFSLCNDTFKCQHN